MTDKDAEYLLARPEFKRFLYAAIQSAGCLTYSSPAHGHETRDFNEGRRSLGFELLHMAHTGQPEVIRAPDTNALATLDAVLREAMNPQENKRDRRSDTDRYGDIDE